VLSAGATLRKYSMNDTIAVEADELARLASILQNGLAEAESTILVLNERLAVLAAVGCVEIKIDGPAVFSRTAGMSGAATDERIVYAAALVMPGGIGASRWGGDEYAERFPESPNEQAIGYRFVPFDDCPPVVRALIFRHASRLVGALLRDFQVLAS
jgi:hypothetical protein